MKSNIRVKKAIHFDSPDHIPHYLPDGKHRDILWLWPKRPPEKKPWTKVSERIDERIDEWGVLWQRGEQGSFGEAKEVPIKDIVKQSECVFPDKNNPIYLSDMSQSIKENNLSENPKYCLGVMPFSSLNEGTHNIMGLDKMFMAYYEHPKELKALIARLAEAQRESIKKLAEMGCNGVMGYDDWGLQDQQMISTDLIEEFFMPHYRKNWKLAHSLGLDVWMHSCGYIINLLPIFIDAGLNVIQMDQQENMGLENLDAKVGGKICFWCPVDIQKTMIEGSLEDIESYVKRMMKTIGNHKGGLISMAYTTPDAVGHTPEKIDAMCQSFRKYGVYNND